MVLFLNLVLQNILGLNNAVVVHVVADNRIEVESDYPLTYQDMTYIEEVLGLHTQYGVKQNVTYSQLMKHYTSWNYLENSDADWS